MNKTEIVSIVNDAIKKAKEIDIRDRKTQVIAACTGAALMGGLILFIKKRQGSAIYRRLPKDRRKVVDRVIKILNKYDIELEDYVNKDYITLALAGCGKLAIITENLKALGNLNKLSDSMIVDVIAREYIPNAGDLSYFSTESKIDMILDEFE